MDPVIDYAKFEKNTVERIQADSERVVRHAFKSSRRTCSKMAFLVADFSCPMIAFAAHESHRERVISFASSHPLVESVLVLKSRVGDFLTSLRLLLTARW